MGPYFYILLFLVFILGFIAFSLGVNAVFGPRRKDITPADSTPFECGVPPVQELNTTQVPLSYYQLAIMFVLFDLEGIFLFLWAMATPPVSHFLFITFILFMAILILMLIYVWQQGLLDVLARPSGDKKN
jgi:NADH-quinone oxidoreductase subunit A